MSGIRILTRWKSVTILLFGGTCCIGAIAGEPHGLQVEYRENPVGMDVVRPRFSWKLPAGVRRQSAYEIEADGWNSGKVESGESLNVAWGGTPLRASQRVRWRVRVWDEAGRVGGWSEPATFVMGMLDADWQADWIGPCRATRPDVAMDDARWIGGNRIRGYFKWNGTEGVCELVYACTRPHRVYLNGTLLSTTYGMVYDWRNLRFRNIRPLVRRGLNTLEFELSESEFPRQKIRTRVQESATLALVRLPEGVRYPSDGTWEGTLLGKARETEWGGRVDFREEVATPAFRKSFVVDKAVRRATLHVTGLGFYEASLNGRKIGEKVMDPSPTDYDKRVLYSTYLLDGDVREGTNELEIVLGHGWYDVRAVATWNFDTAPWRDFPRCIARLELEYADGASEALVTDETWRQVPTDLAFDCVREGEVIGSREPPPVPPDAHAVRVAAPKGVLQAEEMPGAKVVRRLRPRTIRRMADGSWLVEFPENVSGWASVRFRGLGKGDEVTVRYDEMLTPEGGIAEPVSLTQKRRKWDEYDRLIDMYCSHSASQRFATEKAGFQVDHFISAGRAEERYEPRFISKGFRYVILGGLKTPPRAEDIEACEVRTDFVQIGGFSCSDAALTELVRMYCNSYCANFSDGYPTDCPHREKLGWTGDAWIASEAAQYFFENTAAYGKWLQDVIDTQLGDGQICSIAPTSGWGYQQYNGPVFDTVLAALPWNLYAYRGDRRSLDRVYPALCRYLAMRSGRESSPGLAADGLGDWNSLDSNRMPSSEFVISSSYYHLLALASKIAAARGLPDDSAKYKARADRTAAAINGKYYRGDGLYDNGMQTAQALPLVLGFAPAADREKVAARLVEAVERTGGHVDLGLVGMKHVFRALSVAGRSDLAIRMLTNPTAPSPATWIGKTSTLWENWHLGDSKCHVMFGDFAAWACQYLAGIRLEGEAAAIPEPSRPGFRRFLVAPDVNCGLTWAKAEVDGPCGKIVSSWRKEGSRIVLEVTVPPNSEAVARLGGAEQILVAGKHILECKSSQPTGRGTARASILHEFVREAENPL